MPYTQTTREFFESAVPALMPGLDVAIAKPVVFEIVGKDGGTWTVDFGKRTVTEGKGPPPLAVMVKAQERDFMALVEGRMSPADGVLTGRLELAGEAGAIATLVDALKGLAASG